MVDHILKKVDFKNVDKKCLTYDYKVVGSRKDLSTIEVELGNFSNDKFLIKRLLSFYGDRAEEILKIANKEDAAEKIDEKYDIIKAELLYAIRYEYVKKPMDFIERRTSVALIDKENAKKILDRILMILKNELSWNKAKYVDEKNEAMELLLRAL
jgi:glycerol-3-phosphate dehydrogenase